MLHRSRRSSCCVCKLDKLIYNFTRLLHFIYKNTKLYTLDVNFFWLYTTRNKHIHAETNLCLKRSLARVQKNCCVHSSIFAITCAENYGSFIHKCNSILIMLTKLLLNIIRLYATKENPARKSLFLSNIYLQAVIVDEYSVSTLSTNRHYRIHFIKIVQNK